MDGMEGCRFVIIVNTVEMQDSVRSEEIVTDKKPGWKYTYDTSRAFHCHEPEEIWLRT